MLIISTGCPAGVGPEVSVAAAARLRSARCVLVGDTGTLRRAAERVGVESQRLVAFDGRTPRPGQLALQQAGPVLRASDCRPGRPSRRAGAAQLDYIARAYELALSQPERALVTAPVSKAAVARSGHPAARGFTGHTEWLEERDGARSSVMCFWAPRFATSLVTTHLPLGDVPRALSPEGVAEATLQLAELLRRAGSDSPHIAVASLNPHAGESELLGSEERQAIAPGVQRARRRLAGRARITGPVGAETAYRLCRAGHYQGVVAMYHDQATIPMKLVAFGTAVNVTMGLSIVRTSVDHGTGYDIAWQGRADARGMLSALGLARRLAKSP